MCFGSGGFRDFARSQLWVVMWFTWCGVLLITLSRKRNLFWFRSFAPIKFHSTNQPAKWKMHLILKHNRVLAVFLKLSRSLHLHSRTGCRLNLIHFKFPDWEWIRFRFDFRTLNERPRNPSRLIHHEKCAISSGELLRELSKKWPRRG